MNKFHYDVQSSRIFSDAVQFTVDAIEQNRFKVLYVHDVQATLAGKNIEYGPYKIIEFCRAPAAKRVLDADPLIGLFLPCKAVVYELDGKVNVSFLRPVFMKEFFPNADLGTLPEDIDRDIRTIVDSIS